MDITEIKAQLRGAISDAMSTVIKDAGYHLGQVKDHQERRIQDALDQAAEALGQTIAEVVRGLEESGVYKGARICENT